MESNSQQLVAEVRELRDQIGQVRATLGTIADQYRQKLEDIEHRAADGVRREMRKGTELAVRQIQEKPFATTIGVLALGVLLGSLLKMRHG